VPANIIKMLYILWGVGVSVCRCIGINLATSSAMIFLSLGFVDVEFECAVVFFVSCLFCFYAGEVFCFLGS